MSKRKLGSGINETLSAFLDGEASPEEVHALLEALDRDPQLHAAVDRHHHMRASLRGELHPGLDTGFAERVMAGLDDSSSQPGATVTSIPIARPVHTWTRSALGLAMAASLAAVMVFAAQVLLPSADTVFTADIEHDLAALPAAAQSQEDIKVAARRHRDNGSWNDLSPDAAAELNNYLISHNNSAMNHGLGGSMGFMRVAAGDGVAFVGSER